MENKIITTESGEYEGIKTFFDASKGMALIVSIHDASIVYCNIAACSFYLFPTTEIVGNKLDDLCKTNLPSHQTLFEKALHHLNSRFLARQTLKNGLIKEVELYCNQTIIDEKDFLFVQIYDVTKQSNDELRQLYNAHSLQPIFNSLPNILIRTTATGQILNTNLPLDTDLSNISNTYGVEYGKILGCVYALRLENGCGSGNVCKHCDLRNIIKRTFETQHSCSASIVKLHAQTKVDPLQDRYYEVFTNYLDKANQPTVLISISDVTERLHTTQRLNVSQAQLWALVESNCDFIWAVDPDYFAITMFNSSIKRFIETNFGHPVCVGQTPRQLFPPPVALQIINLYHKVLLEGAFTEELQIEEFNVILSLSFNRIVLDGSVIGISIFGRDITQFKMAEFELQQRNQLLNEHQQELDIKQSMLEAQNEQLRIINEQNATINNELQETLKGLEVAKRIAEDSNHLKTSILANMNHEIRTPLNAINGFADLLIRPTVSADKKITYAQMLKQSGMQLLSIVNNLLEAARLESGDIKLRLEKISLQFLADEIHFQYADLAKQKDILLHVSVKNDDQNDVEIQTDPARLKQLLAQVIDNALKFTRQGTVDIVFLLHSDSLQIDITDSGIGIAPDMQSRIFEVFQQADMGMTRKFGGNGLGLSIVKNLVKLLGGTISVESELEHGSHFMFIFPLVIYKKQKPDIVNISSQALQTILIAEDDDINYSYLEAILLINCIQLIRAKDGKEAIDLCVSNPAIDIVLMDIRMPIIDGIEATQQIKKYRPLLPIIATTAFGLAEDRAKLIERGFDDYISKPINANTLWSILQMQWRKANKIIITV